MLLSILLALLPIIVIFIFLMIFKIAADISAIAGWIITMLVACFYFNTDLNVALTASLSGAIASFPITLAMMASIFQVTLMAETGAIARIVESIKTISPKDKIVQLLLINHAFGILATSLGAVTIAILPPIMIALGYSSFVAITLPAAGYLALCIYALLGIPAVIFASFVDLPIQIVGLDFAIFMPITNTAIAFAMLWLAGGLRMLVKGFIPAVIAGLSGGFTCILMAEFGLVTITGIAAGIAMMLALCFYLKLRKLEISCNLPKETQKQHLTLPQAISPWILLIVISLLTNVPFLPFFKTVFVNFAMPIEIIPGRPEKMRIFWQGYFWIFVCSILAIPFLKAKKVHLAATWKKFIKRTPRPALAAITYFAIGYVFNHSAKNEEWVLLNPAQNMVHILADNAIAIFGQLYSAAAPFVGFIIGFMGGTQSIAIAMLTGLHIGAAKSAEINMTIVAAAGAIGGGIASLISPAKIMTAASSIDRIGEEGDILRRCLGVAFILTAIVAVQGYFFALY